MLKIEKLYTLDINEYWNGANFSKKLAGEVASKDSKNLISKNNKQ